MASIPIIFIATFLSCFQISFEAQTFNTIPGVSIWDPFCRPEILYVPYIRVYQGRTGQILRNRGPGFIDLTGMTDIYVCTNGLVMLYYSKTNGDKFGPVYEQGELHWAAHHCELYNPSSNNGMLRDSPRKTLLSILLISHPKDYRNPALQMFVAPHYDVKLGKYINLTSVIMVGNEGECIIEKGFEKAKIRIRNGKDDYVQKIPVFPTPAETPKPVFCQLDAQHRLGQKLPGSPDQIVNLRKPANILNEIVFGGTGYPKPLPSDYLTFEIPKTLDPPLKVREKNKTGATGPDTELYGRFRASTSLEAIKTDYGTLVDEVYAALINDREMKFIGCLKYPDFNAEQMGVIESKKKAIDDLNLDNLLINVTALPFWGEFYNGSWLKEEDRTANKSRFFVYLDELNPKDDPETKLGTFKEAMDKIPTAETNLKAAENDEARKAEVDGLKQILLREKIMFSLWPLKKAFYNVFKYIASLHEQLKGDDGIWKKIIDKLNETEKTDCSTLEQLKPSMVSKCFQTNIQKLAEKRYSQIYEPYDREMYKNMTELKNETGYFSTILRQYSNALGPSIAHAETLQAKLKSYTNVLQRVLFDMEIAIQKIEKAEPDDPVNNAGYDPFDEVYTDTLIEIDNDPRSTACQELPSATTACEDIKPTTERANFLFDAVAGKNSPIANPDSKDWRDEVLTLLRNIFDNVCPYIDRDFSKTVINVFKGYMRGEPNNTGLEGGPVLGDRWYAMESTKPGKNLTPRRAKLAAAGGAPATEVPKKDKRHLPLPEQAELSAKSRTKRQEPDLFPKKHPFWTQIIDALKDCENLTKNKPMKFFHNEADGQSYKKPYISFAKTKKDGTPVELKEENMHMKEKADEEFSFNWVIEQNWRIFATVLGICMPGYETKVPLISARFYGLFSDEFLHPLRQIWMSNRDNVVLQVFLGKYYARGKADKWTKICMESSYFATDRNYRPPRRLYVNAFTEMNYFTTGPMAGTPGKMAEAAEMAFG